MRLGPTVEAHFERIFEQRDDGVYRKMTQREINNSFEQMWLEWEAEQPDEDIDALELEIEMLEMRREEWLANGDCTADSRCIEEIDDRINELQERMI